MFKLKLWAAEIGFVNFLVKRKLKNAHFGLLADWARICS